MVKFAQDCFAPDKFANIEEISDNMIKLVQRSSMVSVFEKPKFKDMVKGMDFGERELLAGSLYELLHGDEAKRISPDVKHFDEL